MTLRTLFATAAVALTLVSAAGAQPSSPDETSARDTRERLQQLLDQYPPSVRQVLRLDPSLLTKPEYIATYPALAAYAAQHPEITHNPGYFLGGPAGTFDDRRGTAARSIQAIFEGFQVMFGVMFGIGAFAWLLRSAIDHRRWTRAMKIQTDAHTKIVDRLASNEELLAYMQSPAGQRFLTMAPAMNAQTDHAMAVPVTAPLNRILWSVQAGVVIAVAGAGLWLAKIGVVDEAAQAMQVVAILAMALGVGFVLSAVASYALSQKLGLVQPHVPHA